jgi:hypothetical protein
MNMANPIRLNKVSQKINTCNKDSGNKRIRNSLTYCRCWLLTVRTKQPKEYLHLTQHWG